jgi:hypothetical protein
VPLAGAHELGRVVEDRGEVGLVARLGFIVAASCVREGASSV